MEIVFLLVGVALGWLLDKKQTTTVVKEAQEKANKLVEKLGLMDSKIEEINFKDNEE